MNTNRTRRPWEPRRSLAAILAVGALVMVDDPAGATPGVRMHDSTVESLLIYAPSVRRDAARGWPMRATAEHRADVQRSVARGIRRLGCRVTRVRAVSLRGAAVWSVRTDATGRRQGWAVCRSYRLVRVHLFEDGTGHGYPTPLPVRVPINPPPLEV